MSETRFIRRNGRIIPIRAKKKDNSSLAAVGVVSAVGAIGLEKSRRKVLDKGVGFRVVERKNIFSKGAQIKVKTGLFGTAAKIDYKVKNANANIGLVVSGDPKASLMLNKFFNVSAKSMGAKTASGLLVSENSARIIRAKGGSFTAQSIKTGKTKSVGYNKAVKHINRLIKKAPKAIIKGVIKLK